MARVIRSRIGPRSAVLLVLSLLVLLELSLRTFGGAQRQTQSEPSARLGYRLVPDQSFVTARGAQVRINSEGFRDAEWIDPPDGALSIAVIGDSVAFGEEIDESALWCRVLERTWNARATRRVHVRNYSVPGYTLEQMARVWETSVRARRPALVVLSLAPYSIRPMREREDPAPIPLRRFLQDTAIYRSLDRWIRSADRAGTPDDVLHAEERVRKDPFASENRIWWERALARIGALRADVAANGGRLVLVATPILEHVATAPPASPFADWARARGDVPFIDLSDDLRRAMQPLLAVIRARSVPLDRVWNRFGRDELWDRDAQAAVFFLDDPWHLTVLGHRVVGEALARELALAKLY